MYNQFNKASGTTGCGPAVENNARGRQYGHPYFRNMGMKRPKYNVPMNIIEKDDSYQVNVYATGFTKEDIKIAVVDDILYINGKKEIDESTAPNFSRQEFPIKNFERTLELNGQVDAERISAKSENGILIITLPKSQEAQKKEQTIPVE